MWYYYCKRCGRIFMTPYAPKQKQEKCDKCNYEVNLVPAEYIGEETWILPKERKDRIIEELVKTSGVFDENLFQHRNDKKPARHFNFSPSNQNVPKCPTCQSTNIRNMGSIERGASIMTFGIFSKKINKTFKCSNCGYTW